MRVRLITAAVLGGACLAFVVSESQARVTPIPWPFEKLFKHADLVVVVKPLETREATEKDRAVPPKGFAGLVTGVVTTFRVSLVVKGEHKGKELDLVHFRFKKWKGIGNHSGMAVFRPKKELDDDFPPDYLLFLKKGKGGRLEFVSGNDDPTPSVKFSEGGIWGR